MSFSDYPAIEYVRQCLRYQDGKLYWLYRPRKHFPNKREYNRWNARYADTEAGHTVVDYKPTNHTQCHIGIDGKNLLRHNIVWALHRNEWRNRLDHKNRDSADDRIENLRPADRTQNNANTGLQSTNRSGYKGINWHKGHGKWQARISVRGKRIHLGFFDDLDQAGAVYMIAAREYFGEYSSV